MDVSTVKAEVKAWERSFKASNGRDPTIQDIKDLPHIAEKYKLYKKLSKQTTASSVASSSTHTSSDTPTTPPRLISRSRQFVQPRIMETTAPLASFNPFSPQKNKGKAKAQFDERQKPSKSPFNSKVLPQSLFSVPDLHKPSSSSKTPPAPSSAISRARKRLRGEPVSPTPNKEKRRRVGSQLSLPFTDLMHDSSDSDNDEGEVTISSFLSDSPVKAPSGVKSFKLLFDEKAKSEAALATGRSVIGRTKTQSTSRNLFGLESAIGHDEDALWDLGSQPKTALFKPSSTLPSNEHNRVSKAKVHTDIVTSRNPTKRALSDSDTESVNGRQQHLPLVTSALIPPSPSTADSFTNRQNQFNTARGKSKADVSKRRKVKSTADDKMDDQSESDDDSDSLHANVKIFDRTQTGSNSQGHVGAGDGSDSDPILGYLHRVAPHGHAAHWAPDAQEGKIEIELPDKLRNVLALNSTELAARSIREERMVKGLVLGQRTDHYDPDRGGEIWDVGEDTERIDGEQKTRGDTEGEDEWEGEPVPWEVGEL